MTASAPNQAIVETDQPGPTISRHIYGHFAEHLGRCIYDGFWVGEDSTVPNTRGLRRDIIEALRRIQVPVLRWPGGCFADEYHWQDGLGPRAARPSMLNTHWGGVTESNAFGTHEFMDLCEQLGCEPYICGNVGSGSIREMQQWVEYLTLDGQSPMTDQRRANGRAAPWAVRYWGVGNESWGCGGNMRAEYYADEFRRYATYCRNFGRNRLYKIACGANGADYQWTEVLMREAAAHMDGLSLHYYTVPGTWESKGSATEFDTAAWLTTLRKARVMDELITRHKQIMDRYDPARRVGLIVDEWGAWHEVEPGTQPGFLCQQNSLRDALVAGVTLNIFNQHCDRVHMANLAQTVNVLQALVLVHDGQLVLTPTYHVFDMYRPHQGAALLPAHLGGQPLEADGGQMPGLSLSASRDPAGRVHLSLCNLHPDREQVLDCQLRGLRPARAAGRLLTANAIQAYNTAADRNRVTPITFDALTLTETGLEIALPARSVIVLEIE